MDQYEPSTRKPADRRGNNFRPRPNHPNIEYSHSVTDPLGPGRIARRQTMRNTLSRVHGTLRQSGRRVRQKAATINRSIRYAASRPILPYELIGEVDVDGRRFTSEHEYITRQIEQQSEMVAAPLPELSEEQYATYVGKLRGGTLSDRVLRILLPSRKERTKFFDTYGSLVTCSPPPVFMLLFVTLQIAMFIFYAVREKRGSETIGQDTMDSMWIYDPYKRNEAWRWLTYSVLHYDLEHLIGNLVLQLVIGVLLELIFKWRICIIFMFGIISGSLASSVFDPYVKLLGSSGGSYALIGAYLILFLRRFRDFPRPVRFINGAISLCLLIYVCVDFGYAYYRRHHGSTNVSDVAHIGGMLTGWTIGYATLWNWRSRLEMGDIAPYLGLAVFLVVYLVFVLCAILFNIFASPAGNVFGGEMPKIIW